MVEQGFAALAVMAQCWEDSMPEEGEQNESSDAWVAGRSTIANALSNLLQQAWLRPAQEMVSRNTYRSSTSIKFLNSGLVEPKFAELVLTAMLRLNLTISVTRIKYLLFIKFHNFFQVHIQFFPFSQGNVLRFCNVNIFSLSGPHTIYVFSRWNLYVQAEEASPLLPPPSCIDDSSALLRFIMQSITTSNELLKVKLSELLLVWADLIANWHAWEETEDLSIFNCIKDIVSLNQKIVLKNFILGEMPSPPAPPVMRQSIIEGIGGFISAAFSQYPSATWRASSCVHLLLHVPSYKFEAEGVRQSLVIAFSKAAFSRFGDIKSKPCSLWKPLLLAVSSCYLCYPDVVEKILEKDEHEGFAVWASALGLISSSKFEHGLSSESEMKLSG